MSVSNTTKRVKEMRRKFSSGGKIRIVLENRLLKKSTYGVGRGRRNYGQTSTRFIKKCECHMR